MKTLISTIVLLMTILTQTSVTMAQNNENGSQTFSLEEIKQRMQARLALIEKYKEKGILGENSKGFLEPVKDQEAPKAAADLMKKENKDRKRVYKSIAREIGVKPSLVAIKRANSIFEQAEPNEWLKTADGTWIQKKQMKE